MTKPIRIIFLDIDGPMIPMRAYLFHQHASLDQNLDEMCLRVLRRILDKTSAQVVFNTTHSRHLHPHRAGPGLIARFAAAGFHVGREIHADSSTLYPDTDRLSAIQEWLTRNHADAWVAFDDVRINDDRAFLTDPDHGIGWNEFQHAKQRLLNEEKSLIFLG